MEIRALTSPDRPSVPGLAGAIVVGLGIGLGIASFAASPAPVVEAAEEGPIAAEAPAPEAEPTAEVAPEPPREALPPEPPAPEAVPPVAEPELAEVTPSPAEAALAGPRAWTRVTRGRVAYLRCETSDTPAPEGTPMAGGCPRDAALEEAVWRAIEALPSCATAPAAGGDVDLVVEATPGVPIEVRTRDRFGADVVRMDAAAVLGCVTPAIVAEAPAPALGGAVVSFRFRAVE